MSDAAAPRRRSMGDALWSLLAIFIAMVFFFPLYWAVSTGLRRPAETFTVSGVGIPFIDFQPTLENWISQASVPDAHQPFLNSLTISSSAVLISLARCPPAASALSRFSFQRMFLP